MSVDYTFGESIELAGSGVNLLVQSPADLRLLGAYREFHGVDDGTR